MTTLQAQFVEAARAVQVEIFEEDSAEAVRQRAADLIRGEALLAWAPARLPYGVGDVLGAAKLVPPDADLPTRGEAAVGLTGCDGAIAQTGALVLGSRPGSPRTASLLPLLHVAIVRPDQLHPDLASALAADGEALLRECSTINLVAGPSRTADIELTLTLGVHGPGRVVIVIGP
ncbi:MAG: hypothetical protein GY898_15030 [Proteobacteria bacterium]|nr:hypothetical protein [Pseudomonadota bacterium]